nr:KamA family radical SAM protein [uncultured Desulfobacter sp.]
MSTWPYEKLYNIEVFKEESKRLLDGIARCRTIEAVRATLLRRTTKIFRSHFNGETPPAHELIRMRDCSMALMNIFSERSEARIDFSIVNAFWDIAKGRARQDLKPGFYAEMINWIRGLERRANFQFLVDYSKHDSATNRQKSIERSNDLDDLWESIDKRIKRYKDGLTQESIIKRQERRDKIIKSVGGKPGDWDNWKWQVRNIFTDPDRLLMLASLNQDQAQTIKTALKGRLPFGLTPYYLSLMDNKPGQNDRAIRAQVFPSEQYVNTMLSNREKGRHSFDFMLESDTSPVDRITRRYPGIAILKPVYTCPQICVYCQRNWEIEQVMAPGSFAVESEINSTVSWIKEHPAIREVLITGGDPFIMGDRKIESLLSKLAAIPHVDLIRIGTRTLVTMPMRTTDRLAELLGKFREPGRRDIAVMTHIEHVYEITPETVSAVNKLKRQGISVYNQLVYTFYVSRRFESTSLRLLLRRIGIDPYYTFMPKGKAETMEYQVPLARILQEQKEEARLVPGLRRTDEAVFNVPGLGKNYVRALQHRDLITVLPDGRRVYEFHPWEMNLGICQTYIHKDMAILDYLNRLAEIGEKPDDYDSIWFFI